MFFVRGQELGEGDVVGVLAEGVLQLLRHLVEAPQAFEEAEAQNRPSHLAQPLVSLPEST